MNANVRRRQQWTVRNEAPLGDPECPQPVATPPAQSADDCAGQYYRDDGGEG